MPLAAGLLWSSPEGFQYHFITPEGDPILLVRDRAATLLYMALLDRKQL
jgi:hypothetical protein